MCIDDVGYLSCPFGLIFHRSYFVVIFFVFVMDKFAVAAAIRHLFDNTSRSHGVLEIALKFKDRSYGVLDADLKVHEPIERRLPDILSLQVEITGVATLRSFS